MNMKNLVEPNRTKEYRVFIMKTFWTNAVIEVFLFAFFKNIFLLFSYVDY